MKLMLVLLAASAAFGAEWDAVRRIAPNQKVEITTASGDRMRGTFVSASAEALIMREPSGEQSVMQAQVRQVRVYEPSRRVKRGILWTAIGLGAGIGVGFAACPGCANEGVGSKYVGPGAAAGAGIGALGFLTSPYKTVYKNK
jgi:hypothetical protein